MITKQTASDIWTAYQEIESAQKLILEMEEALAKGEDPNPRDPFGRQRCLQLGVPSSGNGHRLFDVQPNLALSILRAHIDNKRAILAAANERAETEVRE